MCSSAESIRQLYHVMLPPAVEYVTLDVIIDFIVLLLLASSHCVLSFSAHRPHCVLCLSVSCLQLNTLHWI